jgi:hypothetical protein
MNRTLIIILLLILLAFAGGFIYWHQFIKKSTMPEFSVNHANPVIDAIHQTSGKTVELLWHTLPDPMLSHVVVSAWSERYHYESPNYTPNITHAFDTNDKEIGKIYFYYLIAYFTDGTTTESDVKEIVIFDAPQLPSVQSLTAAWLTIDQTPYVRLSWQPAATDYIESIDGYVIYAENFLTHTLIPVDKYLDNKGPLQHLVKLDNPDTADLRFAVASLGSSGNQSARQEVTVRCFATKLPSPSSVTVYKNSKSEFVIKWKYEGNTDIAGFRLFNKGLAIQHENCLTPSLRSWRQPIPPLALNNILKSQVDFNPEEEIDYSFQLAAVSKQGVLSPLSDTASLLVKIKNHPEYISPPVNFIATWAVLNEKLHLKVTWDDSWPPDTVSNYRLEAAYDANRVFELVKEIDSPEEVFFIPKYFNAVTLKLTALGEDRLAHFVIETEVPDPANLMPMARLLDYRVITEENGHQIQWRWRYPNLEFLKGFRIFQEGELIADENIIGKDVRSWLTPSISLTKSSKYEIEAIGYGNTISKRGPAQMFVATPPAKFFYSPR